MKWFAAAMVAAIFTAQAVDVTALHANETVSLPNLIVVFIDDMGWSDLGCFGGAQGVTPHIDRLCSEGIRFTNFYVNSPICSPSRAALTTGCYPQRWKITSYLADRELNERRGMAQWLDPSVPTVARQLHQAGYATGHFGKWHMGGQRDVAEAPLITQYGFDASLTNFEGLGSRVLPLCDNHDGQPPYRHAIGSDTLGRGPIRWMNRSDITAEFVRGAMAFMDDAQKRGKPVYVNLWPDDVHSPFHPPASRQGDGSKRSRYLGVLTTMDEQLGVLFDYVRDNLAWRDDTLILLASDNGPEAGAGVSTPLRGSKGMLYEGGVRSPLIVWGPGLIDRQQRGAMNERSVLCSLDLARSLLALAQVTPPPDALLDGKDLSQTLLGRSVEGRGEPIAWRRPPDRPGDKQSIWPDLAVRDGRWKLLMAYDGSQPQLYDLQADPQEAKDLAAQHPDVVNRLRRWLLEWHGAMPPDAGPALGTQLQNQGPR